MASVHEYKRMENKLVQKVVESIGNAGRVIAGIFKAFGRFLTRRYTLVFVPHSEKKVYNLHITVLSAFCFFLVVFGIIGGVFLYGSTYNNNVYTASNKDTRLRDTQASLDLMRDETALMFKQARNFQNALTNVFKALGIGASSNLTQNTTGDLSSIINISETQEGVLPEINGIRQMSTFFSEAVDPILEIGRLLDTQGALLTEIPSIWPVRGGIGNITMFFGQNIHPITGLWHIHRGIDIATYRSGDPIVSTADGAVVTVEYAFDYGNYVIVRHKHGYYTRYAHMLRPNVQVGQRVQQGETIGFIGNTGISTGPHLHYEVHIGSDVVDPYRYITMRSNLTRGR